MYGNDSDSDDDYSDDDYGNDSDSDNDYVD
jgi:hypothetical protein